MKGRILQFRILHVYFTAISLCCLLDCAQKLKLTLMLNKYILCSWEVLLKFLHILLIHSVPLVRLEQPCHNLNNCWRKFLNFFVSRLQLLVLWTFLGHCLASNHSHTDSNTIKDNLQSTRWGFRNHGTRFCKTSPFCKVPFMISNTAYAS